MAGTRRSDTHRIPGWPQGSNNRLHETQSSGFLREAVNVDISKEGNVSRREGFAKKVGGYAHSLWSGNQVRFALAVIDGKLVKLEGQDLVQTTLAEVAANSQLSATEVNGEVYWSNGVKKGKVDSDGFAAPWGAEYVPHDYVPGASITEEEFKNLQAPPAGHIVRYFSGRIYIARNETVVFTEALMYDWCRPANGMFMFPDRPVLLEPSGEGLYVSYEGATVYIHGSDPYDVRQEFVSATTAIPGASHSIDVAELGLQGYTGQVPVWWTREGVLVAGLPGGNVQELTRDNLALPEHKRGAVFSVRSNGSQRIVSTLHNPGEDNRMGASDSVVAEVRRNAIKLN